MLHVSPCQVTVLHLEHLVIHTCLSLSLCVQHSKRMSPAERRRLQADSDAKKLALAALDHMEDNKPYSLSNLAWSQATLPLGPPQFLPKVRSMLQLAAAST